MAFNPLNLQLKRQTDGVKRRHSFVQLKQSTIFGRSSISDVKLFGKKCSKKQCSIIFRDGEPWLTDFSSNGTFVNDIRVQTETKLSENDQISFGLGPELADVRNQDTYVFTVTRQDFIELDDSDDDNDKDVQIAEPTDGENECCDVGDLQITPVDELEGQSVETHEPKEQENCKSKEKGNSTSQSHSKDPVLGISKLQELKERQESLRHWNISKPPIIDPLPMKIGRRKKQPVAGQPPEVNPQCASKKKRGPVPKDRKEKLAALVKPVVEKTTEPKPRRGLKIKITQNNRGNFLIVPPADQKSSSDTDKD